MPLRRLEGLRDMPAARLEAIGVARADAGRMVEAFYEGQYQLLCGAGISLGAPGGDGQPLELAKATAREMALALSLADLEDHEREDLAFVYEEAKAKSETKLRQFLTRRYIECQPTWQQKILTLHWQRLWTLNIDDILENAFRALGSDVRYGRLSSISWRDQLTPVSLGDRELQIIHLHGIARLLRSGKNDVVFSLPEYSEVVRALPPWHAAFQTSYVQSPFIICGAKFTEEPEFVLATRITNQSEKSVGIPSFIVTPGFTQAQATKLRRFGLVPVAAEGEKFFDALHADLESFTKTRATTLSKFAPGVLERFSSLFRRLEATGPGTLPKGDTDFFGGDQPTWNDIVAERDVTFTLTSSLLGLLNESAPKCFVAVLTGAVGTGKSTALLRVARAALQRGMQPFLFRNEEVLDVGTATAFLEANPRSVLLFDDAADHSAAVGKLAAASQRKGIACKVFVAERVRRIRGFRLDISDTLRREFEFRRLSESDLRDLVVRRRQVARLGKYIRHQNDDLEALMRDAWHRELLECLSQIEFGQGFRDRISRYVDSEIKQGADRTLLAAIACVHRFGFSLPLRLALSYFSEIDGFKKVLRDGDTAEGLVVRDQSGVRLRHRIISEYIWKSVVSAEERYTAIHAISERLAPLINPAMIAAKSIPHRIVREMLDQDVLVSDIGLSTKQMFDELELAFDWSSRYWDQRALFEYRIEKYSKAYSYAQKAVSLERHAFAYTTLGTICLKEAVRYLSIEPPRAKEFFFEGSEALDMARKAAERQELSFEHPFVAFFSQAARFVRALPREDIDFFVVAEHWGTWFKTARASTVFQSRYGEDRLRDIEGTWLKLQLARDNPDRGRRDAGNQQPRGIRNRESRPGAAPMKIPQAVGPVPVARMPVTKDKADAASVVGDKLPAKKGSNGNDQPVGLYGRNRRGKR